MPQKQEEQATAEKDTDSSSTNTEECQRISDKCDIIVKKIKNRPRTKKRVKNDWSIFRYSMDTT